MPPPRPGRVLLKVIPFLSLIVPKRSDKLQVLLCFLDGAERRQHLQAKPNRLDPGSKASPMPVKS